MNADLNCRTRISHHGTWFAVIALYPSFANRSSAWRDDNPSESRVSNCFRISSSESVAWLYIPVLFPISFPVILVSDQPGSFSNSPGSIFQGIFLEDLVFVPAFWHAVPEFPGAVFDGIISGFFSRFLHFFLIRHPNSRRVSLFLLGISVEFFFHHLYSSRGYCIPSPIMAPYREYTSFTSSMAFGLSQSCIHSDTSDSTVMGITPAWIIRATPYL
jgi:hypothetical protein